MIEISDAEKLARAVLLFHRGGPWSDTDRELWRHYTGSDDATTRSLCDLARRVMRAESARTIT